MVRNEQKEAGRRGPALHEPWAFSFSRVCLVVKDAGYLDFTGRVFAPPSL
jgi:hypothetical protein